MLEIKRVLLVDITYTRVFGHLLWAKFSTRRERLEITTIDMRLQ